MILNHRNSKMYLFWTLFSPQKIYHAKRNSAFHTPRRPECVVVFLKNMIYTLCNLNIRLKTIYVLYFFFSWYFFLTSFFSKHCRNFEDRLKKKIKSHVYYIGGLAGYFNDYKLNAGFVYYGLSGLVCGRCLARLINTMLTRPDQCRFTWHLVIYCIFFVLQGMFQTIIKFI